MIWTLTQVAAGGALGALARFGTQSGAFRIFGAGFPVGTMAVNVIGSFMVGVLFVWLSHKGLMRHAPFLIIGFLGAYTTFSAYALDALTLWERGLHGQAVVYVIGSVCLSLGAIIAGAWLARGWIA